MKYILFLIYLIGVVHAEEPQKVQEAYPYVTVGGGTSCDFPLIGIFPLLDVGGGFRKRWGRSGIDGSLSISTIVFINQFQGRVVGHFYTNPYNRTSPYLGIGLAGGYYENVLTGNGYSLSPDFIFGRTWNKDNGKKRFLELHIHVPNWEFAKRHNKGKFSSLPQLFVKYGFGW